MPAPGTTILIHGFQFFGDGLDDDFDPVEATWGVANITSLLDAFGGGRVYVYNPDTGALEQDDRDEFLALDDPQGEQVVVHDWSRHSNDAESGHAEAAAESLFAALVNAGVVDPQHPAQHPPMHIIGHSRGASVASELIQRMGAYGIQVAYATYLDAHDWDEGDIPFDGFFWDPATQVWNNTLYADNFWQDSSFAQPLRPSGRQLDHLQDNTLFDRNLTGMPGFPPYSPPPPGIPTGEWQYEPHSRVIRYYFGTLEPGSYGHESASIYSGPEWYPEDGVGFASGFWRWLDRGGYAYTNPTNEGFNTDPAFQRADPLNPTASGHVIAFPGGSADHDQNDADWRFVSGDFELSDLNGIDPAGWIYHGGGGGATLDIDSGNHFLQLNALVASNDRRHSRVYVPYNAVALKFKLWIDVPLAGAELQVFMDQGTQLLVPGISLSNPSSTFVDRTAPIPGTLRNGVHTITFKVINGNILGQPLIGIDDIVFLTCEPPDASLAVSAASSQVCLGTGTSVFVASSEVGVNYTLLNAVTGEILGSSITGTGGTLTLPTGELTSSTTFAVFADRPSCAQTTLNQQPTVVVIQPPDSGLPVGSTANPICAGNSTAITVASSQNGISYQLRRDSDNALVGTPVLGNGSTISLPTGVLNTTTTFNVLATSAVCGSVQLTDEETIIVNPLPVAPTGATATPSSVCAGGLVTLTAAGGSGTTLEWYSSVNGDCGVGASIGTGPSIQVAVSSNTTFFARWTTVCGASTCVSANVMVMPAPAPPTEITTSPPVVCSGAGGSLQLTAVGGAGTSIEWFEGTCGGSVIGTENPLVVAMPSGNTTYYARWVSSCGESACVSKTITVEPLPAAPTNGQASPATICVGQASMLTANVGADEVVDWFTSSCGGTPVANPPLVSPSATTTYFGRARNATTGCVSASCIEVTVTVCSDASAVLYVDDSAPTGGCGASWTTAFNSLQDALAHALCQPGNLVGSTAVEIRVAQGTYRPAGPGGSRSATFLVSGDMRLIGGFAGVTAVDPDAWDPTAHPTYLSGDLDSNDGSAGSFANYGDNSYHVVTADSTTTPLTLFSGFIVRAGNADGNAASNTDRGGGLFINGGDPKVESNRFEFNSAGESGGGGVFVLNGDAHVVQCTFTSNRGAYAGGLNLIGTLGTPNHVDVRRCVFHGNQAVSMNGIGGWSGGIGTQDTNSEIRDCLFIANSALGAAAVGNYRSDLQVVNCTVVGNVGVIGAAVWGGHPDSGLLVANCLIVENSIASGTGEAAQLVVVEGTSTIEHNCVDGWTGTLVGTGNSDCDPLFIDPTNGDYHIAHASPCVDTGSNAWVTSTGDLDGSPRVADGNGDLVAIVDRGAFEVQRPDCPADIGPPPSGDGIVNVTDLLAVIASWGPCAAPCPPHCSSDIAPPGGDCQVNVSDLLAVIAAWGACP